MRNEHKRNKLRRKKLARRIRRSQRGRPETTRKRPLTQEARFLAQQNRGTGFEQGISSDHGRGSRSPRGNNWRSPGWQVLDMTVEVCIDCLVKWILQGHKVGWCNEHREARYGWNEVRFWNSIGFLFDQEGNRVSKTYTGSGIVEFPTSKKRYFVTIDTDIRRIQFWPEYNPVIKVGKGNRKSGPTHHGKHLSFNDRAQHSADFADKFAK